MKHTTDNHALRTAITVPHSLPDEAAAALIALLHELAEGLEAQYAAQLRRYYQPNDERQTELWADNETPF